MKYLLLSLLLFAATITQAQINLVPNPSFEDTLNCDSFQIYHAGFPWFTPTNCTPDYYYGLNPICGNSSFQNPSGYQLPFGGIAYIGFFATDGASTREYITSLLIDTLISGKDYYLEFYISRANLFAFATDDIGAYVSNQIPINTGCSYLPYQPQVENPQGNIITDSLNWTMISGVFTAQGGEKYLTIGNFKDSINTTIIDADSGNGEYYNSYYYIDKVSLIPLDSLQGLNLLSVDADIPNIYPTFLNSGIILHVDIKDVQNCMFNLFTSDGKLCISGILSAGSNNIETDDLFAGVYILNVISKSKVYSKKVVVY